MSELQATQFLLAMQEDNGKVIDLVDALCHAMDSVPEYIGPRWFGSIGEGVFFADMNTWRWFDYASEPMAVYHLKAEFSEALTEGF